MTITDVLYSKVAKMNGLYTRNYDDISGGVEKTPIPFEEKEPHIEFTDFVYVACNVPGPDTPRWPFAEQFEGCQCAADITCSNDCPCIARFGVAYSKDKTLIIEESESIYQHPIYECNKMCQCSKNCSNRVVQHGVQTLLQVYREPKKGLALRTSKPIPKNVFVCEYAGEVLTDEMAMIRTESLSLKDHYYIMTLREHLADGDVLTTYVDPAYIGNAGRFINHSCEPNLFMVPVRVNHGIAKLALFAKTDIEPGTELTFDYGGGNIFHRDAVVKDSDTDSGIRDGDEGSPCTTTTHTNGLDEGASGSSGTTTQVRKVCLCGSTNCRGYLPFDPTVLAVNDLQPEPGEESA